MKTRNRILAAHILALFAIAAACYLTACAGFKAAWSKENRGGTIAALESDALSILGRAGLSLLQGLAADNGDFAHSASQAAWATLDVGSIAKVIRDAGGGAALADNAAGLARKAMSKSGVSEKDAIDAVAAAIASGALKVQRHD